MLKNVLIVDDVAVNRKIIALILSKNIDDINIIEASNGIDALDIIRDQNISVIILDIMMPIIDGLETLSKIKKNPLSNSIPVIMCSALDNIENVKKSLELGALDYFTKPLTEEEIRITLPLKVKNAIEYYERGKELEKYKEHMKKELFFAEKLQKSLISNHKDFKNVEMWSRYIPCQEVGGDIYCTKQINEKLWFIIADICGHGFSAAMMSTMLSVLFNTKVEFCDSPGELLRVINNTFFEVFGEAEFNLISAFAGFFSENTLLYSNAGHPYPLLYSSMNKQINILEEDGYLLGMFNDVNYDSMCININSRDKLILYTDGLYDNIENRNTDGWTDLRTVNNQIISKIHFKKKIDLKIMKNHQF